jgi:bacteriorhodopsin
MLLQALNNFTLWAVQSKSHHFTPNWLWLYLCLWYISVMWLVFKNIRDRCCVLRIWRYIRLLPQSPRGLCCLEMLLGMGWQLVTGISGQSIVS